MAASSFLVAVQVRAARIAVGPSAVRRQGAGCAKAGRIFLGSLDLKRFASKNDKAFRSSLDQVTSELQAALPKKSRSWGLPRKLLKIFLRDALYTSYLKEAYTLEKIEPYLEIPLDSITADNVKRAAGRGVLPVWPGVKHLKMQLSDRMQSAASKQALVIGIHRVHLDTYWWGLR